MSPSTGAVRALALALLALAALPAASAATVIDSFTDPLPPNPLLPASGQPILFLGPVCDGASCPPSSTVSNVTGHAYVEQSGLPGVPAGFRRTGLSSMTDGYPDLNEAILRLDPAAAGRLILTRGTNGFGIVSEWGNVAHPMNLDLTADGGDHFEIEILSATPGRYIGLEAARLDANGVYVEYSYLSLPVSGPGVLSFPFASFTAFPSYSPLTTFADDVDVISMSVYFTRDPMTEFVLGEVRTAGTPVPSRPVSWGRVKGTYRQ